jgi:hypothetical protein
MASGDLNFRQRQFVAAYLGKANGNATEAARIAGYANPNIQSARLLVNVSIRTAIDAKLKSAAISADEVLARLSDRACCDINDFVKLDKNGEPSLDLLKARKSNKLSLVKKLTPTKWGWSIELHDPQAALIQLGKYHGLWDGDKAPKEEVEALTRRLEVSLNDARYDRPTNDQGGQPPEAGS